MGIETVKSYLRIAPKSSGVYQFFNSKRDVIYIGKAKNLHSRLTNYATLDVNSHRICQMIANADAVDVIKTNNELEALLLEANLIKKYQPKFNVVWRDDKNYFYLAINRENTPYIFITHQRNHQKTEFVKIW